MAEIQQNRWDQLVRRAANIVSPGSMVNDALAELFPMIDVENMPGELLYLSGTRICLGAERDVASAGNNHLHQVFNPADSGQIITVTDVIFSSDTAQRIRFALQTFAFASLTSNQAVRDSRTGVIERPVGEIRSVTQAAGIPAFGEVQVAANLPFHLTVQNDIAVLLPGTGLSVATTTLNTEFITSWFWRERQTQAAETNF